MSGGCFFICKRVCSQIGKAWDCKSRIAGSNPAMLSQEEFSERSQGIGHGLENRSLL